MDQVAQQPMNLPALSRRSLLKLGAAGAACAAGGGSLAWYLSTRVQAATAAEVFKDDAPQGELWEQWKKRGWAREARHYLKLGKNLQCKLCPNGCVLGPEDRGRCRNRVHKDGVLYTLGYGTASSVHNDPIEKKPLFHFLPGTTAFSFATAGCGFRCLNCQNWSISQRKPEELKDPRGEPVRLKPRELFSADADDINRMSIFPDDMVAMAEYFNCRSIAYTYSEPTVWFEYMIDTAKAARAKNLKNVLVTCGYIEAEPLAELCQYLDGVHVDLKGFDDEIYSRLNSGHLAPVLETILRLRRAGVWFEVVNLIVPTYTDRTDKIRQMCRWMVDKLGRGCPVHFSRFMPQHKLLHLPQTPVDALIEAREIAREEGLHYVYIGNCSDAKVVDPETTFCPSCKKPVVERSGFSVSALELADGKCKHCKTLIPGVWA